MDDLGLMEVLYQLFPFSFTRFASRRSDTATSSSSCGSWSRRLGSRNLGLQTTIMMMLGMATTTKTLECQLKVAIV